jgi:hypothetical protein
MPNQPRVLTRLIATSTKTHTVAKLEEQEHRRFVSTIGSSRMLIVFVSLLVIFIASAQPITDPDFWWHLKTGQHIFATRTIPHTDIFSNVRFGSEWVTHEWLAEVLIYSIFRLMGFGGLIVSFSVIITASFWVMYRLIKQVAGHPYIAAFTLLLGGFATLPTWGVRPQMFSLLFASVFVVVLNRHSRNERTHEIWWLVPLMILWANMHAGFALGLALIALTIAGLALDAFMSQPRSISDLWTRLRPLIGLLAISIAVVCINPNGARLYTYPFETLKSQAMMQFIQEWKTPNFQEPYFQALALLFFATFSALALSNKRPRPGELLMLAVTGWAVLRSGRNVAFFSLIAMPLLAEHLWNWVSSNDWGKWLSANENLPGHGSAPKLVLNGLLIVIALSIAAFGVDQATAQQQSTEIERFPKAAVDFVQTNKPPQPIYNEYVWGGYLIWKLSPDYRVYIDGRADVYGDELMKESLAIHDGKPTWRMALDNRGIKTVLVKPDIALASLLRQDAGWHIVYEDKQALIFVRR